MTTASNWDYTDTVTVWPVTRDEYDQPSYGTPVTYACSWMSGGRMARDDVGQEFYPNTTAYIETDTPPAKGSRMMIGTHTGAPDSTAEVIRVVQTFNDNTFSWGTPDVALLTG